MRLEGWPRATVVQAAILRDASHRPQGEGLLLRMRSESLEMTGFMESDAAQQECCEAGSTLLCMGLFSRFFVQALPCTATSCSNRPPPSCAVASARSAPGRPRSWMPLDGLLLPADRACRAASAPGRTTGAAVPPRA